MQDDEPNHGPHVSEAEAFELFQSGDSVLSELRGIETLDELVAAVRNMTRDEEGRDRLLNALVTAVAREATVWEKDESKDAPLGAAYRVYEDEAWPRYHYGREEWGA
jgi:hypothetical protein